MSLPGFLALDGIDVRLPKEGHEGVREEKYLLPTGSDKVDSVSREVFVGEDGLPKVWEPYLTEDEYYSISDAYRTFLRGNQGKIVYILKRGVSIRVLLRYDLSFLRFLCTEQDKVRDIFEGDLSGSSPDEVMEFIKDFYDAGVLNLFFNREGFSRMKFFLVARNMGIVRYILKEELWDVRSFLMKSEVFITSCIKSYQSARK
jgi:hypothetical protein